jgi:transcriptional regulator with XRE-family HTH domain
MTAEEMTALRKSLGLTQAEMGERIGLALRSVQEIESGKTPLRLSHALAAERIALGLAVERKEPMLAPAAIRREALELVRMITG